MFASTRSRVNTMALIHEKLYRSTYEGGTMLQFDEYLRDLLRDLAQSHSADQKGIEVRMEVEPISLHIDLAVPCGLVVNELVTNAFKHAFADRGGTLRLTLARQGPDVRLEVSDNGAGIPVLAAGAGGRRTLGTQLVQTLVSQLRGKYDARSEEGTTISVVFPARTPEA
jgi:two-component sensor histidine kinase